MSMAGGEKRCGETTTPVPTRRLRRKTRVCLAPCRLDTDLVVDITSEVESVGWLFDALGSSDANWSGHHCTIWNVDIIDHYSLDALNLPPLSCRLERQSQRGSGRVVSEVHVHVRGVDILPHFWRCMSTNVDVGILHLRAPYFGKHHWCALIDCLEQNMCLQHLTVRLTRCAEKSFGYTNTRWQVLTEKMSRAILRMGSLQTLQVYCAKPQRGWCPWHERPPTRTHKQFLDVAMQLSQVCRLDTSAGRRQRFKSAAFRWRLLLCFLCPTANKKMCETSLRTGSLHILQLKHMCWDELLTENLDSWSLSRALRANRRAGAVNKHLRQLCRLKPCSRGGFSDSDFRWWILSQFLSPEMDAESWQIRILGLDPREYRRDPDYDKLMHLAAASYADSEDTLDDNRIEWTHDDVWPEDSLFDEWYSVESFPF